MTDGPLKELESFSYLEKGIIRYAGRLMSQTPSKSETRTASQWFGFALDRADAYKAGTEGRTFGPNYRRYATQHKMRQAFINVATSEYWHSVVTLEMITSMDGLKLYTVHPTYAPALGGA